MNQHLFLDDLRIPSADDTVTVRTFEAFCSYLDSLEKDDTLLSVSFDHDLGEDKSGLDCARYLLDKWRAGVIAPCPTFVHSANPVGASAIIAEINKYIDDNGISPNIACRKMAVFKWETLDNA